MFINFYIARPTYCFFLMHTSGLTVVIKQTCYVMLQISNNAVKMGKLYIHTVSES